MMITFRPSAPSNSLGMGSVGDMLEVMQGKQQRTAPGELPDEEPAR